MVTSRVTAKGVELELHAEVPLRTLTRFAKTHRNEELPEERRDESDRSSFRIQEGVWGMPLGNNNHLSRSGKTKM